jgi:DNA polymerase III alpha subunit
MTSYESILDSATEKRRRNLSGQIDLFSSAEVKQGSPGYKYQDIPEFSLRDRLMLEKDSSGMYFSGHLIDSFSKCIADINLTPIADITGDESEEGQSGTVSEGQRVFIAGIVNSVTAKITKKDERMAFIKIEDRYGEIECILFPKIYRRYHELIHIDSGIYIDGTVQLREDEPVRLIVNEITPLVENGKYNEKVSTGALRKDFNQPVQDAAGVPQNVEVHRAAPGNTGHLDGTTDNSNSGIATSATTTGRTAAKIYLRVPDTDSREYKKAVNLIEIFTGSVPVIFFDVKKTSYSQYEKGIALTDFVAAELRGILGEKNVVIK